MIPQSVLLALLVVALFGGILSGVPVAFVLLGVPMLIGLLGNAVGSFDMAFIDAFPARVFGLVTNPILVSVPLFVLMGTMLERSNIAKRMMLTAGALFGNLRGGMALAVIVVGALLAASTGVIGATILMLGMIALPAMLSANYSPRLTAGIICASGSLGQIIPPSILLILLADQISSAYMAGRRMAGDWAADPVSVGDLFAGALLPGLMLVGLYITYVLFIAWLRPQDCPPVKFDADQARKEGIETTGWRTIVATLLVPLGLILLVLGSILGGIATPTESAALGAGGTLLIIAYSNADRSSWRRRLYQITGAAAIAIVMLKLSGTININNPDFYTWLAAGFLLILIAGLGMATWQEIAHGELLPVAKISTIMVSMLLLIVVGAAMLSLVFRGLGGEELVHHALQNIPGGQTGALLAVMAVIFLLGFIIEYVEIIFIVVPIAAPPLFAAGVDPVWLAILISMNLQMSFLTPPFGFALFYLRNVAPPSLTTKEIYVAIVPFVAIQLFALSLVATYPSLATWLPKVIY
jgi:tripartite ATP-independent transporter DctM subunit